MKTSNLYKSPIADLHSLKREKWDTIKALRASDEVDEVSLRAATEDMAYIQKALQDRTEEENNRGV